jgi:N-acyl-phosphatidylethanolamine-hydrolysing phospholipase D
MAAAHHLPDGSFRNPWPDSELPGWRDVIRVLKERLASATEDALGRGAFPVSTPAIAYPRAGQRDFTATWIGHSTVLLQIGGLNVLTDPVFCERASPVQWLGPRRVMDPALAIDALPPLDVVLISHNHYDHLDKAAVRHLAAVNPRATWVVPLGLGAFIRGCGVRDIVELDWWQSADVSGLVVTGTPARHFSGRWINDRNKTLWSGFALSIRGWRGFFAGDTAYHGEFSEIGARCGPFDFTMMPIGAYEPRWFMRVVHMDPEEAVRVYKDLVSAHVEAPQPLMLAIHWGTFRLTDEPMDEPPRRAAERWRAVGLDPERLWIARFGETRIVVR